MVDWKALLISVGKLRNALRTSDLVTWSRISLICKAGSKKLGKTHQHRRISERRKCAESKISKAGTDDLDEPKGNDVSAL